MEQVNSVGSSKQFCVAALYQHQATIAHKPSWFRRATHARPGALCHLQPLLDVADTTRADSGHFSPLHPRLISLKVHDCAAITCKPTFPVLLLAYKLVTMT